MKHPRRSIPLLCLAILLGAVALGAAAHTSTSASSSRLSQAADDVHTLHQLLGSAQVDTMLSGQQPTALEDLDTSQLEALFNALGDEESYSLEESEQAGAIQAKIAAILNLRTQDLPPETTPVTLVRLSRTAELGTATCQVPLSSPHMAPAARTLSPPIQPQVGPNQKIQAQLDRLLSFHDRIQQEATEENAYDLWCVLWDDILQEPQPTLTAPEA